MIQEKEMIKFYVFGEPRGKGRPRTRVVKGKFAQIYTDDETANYESKIATAYINAYKEKYKDKEMSLFALANEPLNITINVYLGLSKSDWTFYKKLGETKLNKQGERKLETFATKKPDVDNIAKIVMDSLNGVAYFDDCQVSELFIRKRYTAYQVGIEVEITKI